MLSAQGNGLSCIDAAFEDINKLIPFLSLLVARFEFHQRGGDLIAALQYCRERIPHLVAIIQDISYKSSRSGLITFLGTYEVMSMKFSCCLFNSNASSIRRF